MFPREDPPGSRVVLSFRALARRAVAAEESAGRKKKGTQDNIMSLHFGINLPAFSRGYHQYPRGYFCSIRRHFHRAESRNLRHRNSTTGGADGIYRFRSFNIYSLENIDVSRPEDEIALEYPSNISSHIIYLFSRLNRGVTDSTYLLRAKKVILYSGKIYFSEENYHPL